MTSDLTGVEQVILQTKGALPRLLFVLAGPSGVGKNTIISSLLTNNPRMERVRTYTTRQRRPEEIEGEQYHFVTSEAFRELALRGRLMEADALFAGQDVYGLGKLYSMPADVFEEIGPNKHLVIAEVDIYGTRRLKARYPDCVTIFVTAPPGDLLERIRERKDDFMDDDALAHRMRTAYDQFAAASEFDYVVFNREDQLEQTQGMVGSIILAERNRVRPGVVLEAMIPQGALKTPFHAV